MLKLTSNTKKTTLHQKSNFKDVRMNSIEVIEAIGKKFLTVLSYWKWFVLPVIVLSCTHHKINK